MSISGVALEFASRKPKDLQDLAKILDCPSCLGCLGNGQIPGGPGDPGELWDALGQPWEAPGQPWEALGQLWEALGHPGAMIMCLCLQAHDLSAHSTFLACLSCVALIKSYIMFMIKLNQPKDKTWSLGFAF